MGLLTSLLAEHSMERLGGQRDPARIDYRAFRHHTCRSSGASASPLRRAMTIHDGFWTGPFKAESLKYGVFNIIEPFSKNWISYL